MAQLSVANYFNNKKRPIGDEVTTNNARKVLLLDEDNLKVPCETEISKEDAANKIKRVVHKITPKNAPRKTATPRSNKNKRLVNQGKIENFLSNMGKKDCRDAETPNVSDLRTQPVLELSGPSVVQTILQKSSTSKNELSLTEIKQKLTSNPRLAELKASIGRFQQAEKKLELAKQKTTQTKEALTLKTFKSFELEVHLSPQKIKSPEKPYLSPKNDIHGARKNLFGLQSPVKKEVTFIKPSLSLPYKYRSLAEMFRAIDTICQIMYNRKEIITFTKLKPAVEEMLKRNLTEKHLAQIKNIYPEAFSLSREKIKQFGTSVKPDQWELVIKPQLTKHNQLSPEILLDRRRTLFNSLIEKIKDYHQEFLTTLDPPMVIDRAQITRWHPLFDIEQIPDIEIAELPPQPDEHKLVSGSEVLQKAREMFGCNTRMERALGRLQESSKALNIPETTSDTPILKGIPKALLEKVRQKQAAKALETMTRSSAKDKEVQLYLNLPEIARLARNLFVTEKKSVLLLDFVLDKLCNSYRSFIKRTDMENYLRTIAKEIDGWLIFHEIRGDHYVKLSRNSDLSIIIDKLQQLAKLKDS